MTRADSPCLSPSCPCCSPAGFSVLEIVVESCCCRRRRVCSFRVGGLPCIAYPSAGDRANVALWAPAHRNVREPAGPRFRFR